MSGWHLGQMCVLISLSQWSLGPRLCVQVSPAAAMVPPLRAWLETLRRQPHFLCAAARFLLVSYHEGRLDSIFSHSVQDFLCPCLAVFFSTRHRGARCPPTSPCSGAVPKARCWALAMRAGARPDLLILPIP